MNGSRKRLLLIAMAGLLLPAQAVADRQPARCAALASATLTGDVLASTTIDDARVLPAGSLVARRNDGGQRVVGIEGDLCRVQLTHRPAAGSLIRSEVWLPFDWNRRFLGLGNSGEGGVVFLQQLARQAAAGYAVAQTDLGSRPGAPPFSFGIGAPQRVIDFGHRATQLMTLAGQQLTRTFYGRRARHSYFFGCSTGGQQGLSQAQRHPRNYDGIVALAPVTNRTGLHALAVWNYRATHDTPGSYIPQALFPLIQREVLRQCDGLDGLRDGLIDDPRRCRLDVQALACANDQAATNCLTRAQQTALGKLLAGPSNPRTGESIHSGFSPGVMAAPRAFQFALQSPPGTPVAAEAPRGLLHWAPGWAPPFDFDRDMALVEGALAATLNIEGAGLTGFRRAGGRLLVIGGWADEVVPPLELVSLFDALAAANGGHARTRGFARLFMAPGMAHCAGGVGPSAFDRLQPMLDWVERRQAPARIVATKHQGNSEAAAVERTRPLCAYPQVARWRGYGSVDDAATFDCVDPAGDPPATR